MEKGEKSGGIGALGEEEGEGEYGKGAEGGGRAGGVKGGGW